MGAGTGYAGFLDAGAQQKHSSPTSATIHMAVQHEEASIWANFIERCGNTANFS
jgi:hypothetical protein